MRILGWPPNPTFVVGFRRPLLQVFYDLYFPLHCCSRAFTIPPLQFFFSFPVLFHWISFGGVSKAASFSVLDFSGPQSDCSSDFPPQSESESVCLRSHSRTRHLLSFSVFRMAHIARIADTELIVIYTELLSIGQLAPFKFLFL